MKNNKLIDRTEFQVMETISSKFLNGFFRFLFNYFTAFFLGPAGKGIFAFIEVVINLLFTIGHLSIFKTMLHYLNLPGFKYTKRDIFNVNSLLLIISNVFTIIIFYIIYYFNFFSLQQNNLLLLAVIILPLRSLSENCLTFFQCLKHIHSVNLITLLKNFGLLIFILLGYYNADLITIRNVVAAYVINYLIIFLITFYIMKIVLKNYLETNLNNVNGYLDLSKIILKNSLILHTGYISTFLFLFIDQLMLKQMVNFEEVGYYSFGVNIITGILIVNEGIQFVLNSKTSGIVNETTNIISKIFKAIKYSIVLNTIIIILLYFILPVLIKKFIPKFIYTFDSLKYLLFAIIFYGISLQCSSYFLVKKQYKTLTFLALFILIINIVLNYVLIPGYKSKGAAIASLISYFIQSAILLLILIKVKYNNKNERTE